MKSTRLLACLAAVSVLCWSAGACSSSSGDDDDDTGKAGSESTIGGDSGNEAGRSAGGSDGGVPEGGSSSQAGGGGDSTAGMTGEAGSGPSCDGQCELVVVIDPAPRTISRNVSLDVKNKILIEQGDIYFWNYGYPDGGDFEYTILEASVVPTTPPSDGLPALQTLPILASPIQGATFDAGYLYYAISTGAGTAEVQRKKLDTSDGTGAGTKVFSLDDGRIWRGFVIVDGTAYLTGEVDTNMIDQIKTGIYELALPPATADAKPAAITGLGNLDNRIADLTVVGGQLFWTQYDEATTHALLWTAPVAGGTPAMLDDVTQFGGASIAGDPDGTYVYWTNHHHGGRLARCPIANLDVSHIEELAGADNASEGLLVDDGYVYYQEDETLVVGKPIWRVAKDGGLRELLGELSGGFALVGLDDGFVYAQDFDNVVYRVSKTR